MLHVLRHLHTTAVVVCLIAPVAAASPGEEDARVRARHAPVDSATWEDHDAYPVPMPAEREARFWGHQFREGIVEPISHALDIPDKILWLFKRLGAHTQHEAANVNAFDEVPNSEWFTNRNHMHAIPAAQLRNGPDDRTAPRLPWVIKHAKKGGQSAGFQIKDADGKKWLVKLDPRGYPQLSSGADMIARTLLHAAGYNVPHNIPVKFRRNDLTIDPDLLSGKEGEHFTEVKLDTLLARGHQDADGLYYGYASLFLSGTPVGAPSMRGKRHDDPNDWYTHKNRRELRGLYVISAWIGNWDTKDHNNLDMFEPIDGDLGYVKHYLLDVGASLGAAGTGPKPVPVGYEATLDFGWIARRLVTLGFVTEPWRRAHQETGIPSAGNFTAEAFEPEDFTTQQPQPAFRECTLRDAYWGAKVVASFSDAQIAAAVDAARFEDPRASAYLTRALIERRDKIAQYYFARVAPLDFFAIRDDRLIFHDLAVDLAMSPDRAYDAHLVAHGGRHLPSETVHLADTSLPLVSLGSDAERVTVTLSITNRHAKPVTVELERRGGRWLIGRIRHA
jgi:hypothetical protein